MFQRCEDVAIKILKATFKQIIFLEKSLTLSTFSKYNLAFALFFPINPFSFIKISIRVNISTMANSLFFSNLPHKDILILILNLNPGLVINCTLIKISNDNIAILILLDPQTLFGIVKPESFIDSLTVA